ncbi:hypothetical protein OOK75_09175 [Bacillus amyloliquefaciens]|nr:hypothetical protein [Bacillus amyloliquefaciens]MEB4595374.1 hypothetical protein [Bacillus amyloliquefaciens]
MKIAKVINNVVSVLKEGNQELVIIGRAFHFSFLVFILSYIHI